MNFKNILLIIILAHAPLHASLKPLAPCTATALVAPPGGLAVVNSENDKEKKEKIAEVNRQLEELQGDNNWKKRKEIITHAVEQSGIHPDAIVEYPYTPLWAAMKERDEQDLSFAALMLKHGANPNQKETHWLEDPLLPKTVKMAQLLFDHGGSTTITEKGVRLLNHTISYTEPHPELIGWYVDHGVDSNEYYYKTTSLLWATFELSSRLDSPYRMIECIRLLMQAGAKLSPVSTWDRYGMGYNVPQIIKNKLSEAQTNLQGPRGLVIEKMQAQFYFFTIVRNRLIAFSHYRCKGLQDDLKVRLPVPPLCQLIVHYYIEKEPSYEELEALPGPVTSTGVQVSE